jgi:hypothetical protein
MEKNLKTDSKHQNNKNYIAYIIFKTFLQKPGVCENGRGLRIEPGQWYLP